MIVLVRSKNAYGAIVPIAQTMTPEQIQYRWYFLSGTEGRSLFRNGPKVQTGVGTVGSRGPARVKFGEFDVKWSANINGWGYFYLDEDQAICVTGRNTLEGIDPTHEKWEYRVKTDENDEPESASELFGPLLKEGD